MKIIEKLTSMFFEWVMGSKDKNKNVNSLKNKKKLCLIGLIVGVVGMIISMFGLILTF